jgi:hypothetical protein
MAHSRRIFLIAEVGAGSNRAGLVPGWCPGWLVLNLSS